MTVDIQYLVNQLCEKHRKELENGLHYTKLAIILGKSPTYARELAMGLGEFKDFEYKDGRLYYRGSTNTPEQLPEPLIPPTRTKIEKAIERFIREFYVKNYIYLVGMPSVIISSDFQKELRRIYKAYNKQFAIQHLDEILRKIFNNCVEIRTYRDKFDIQNYIISFPSVDSDLYDIVDNMYAWWEKEGYVKTEFKEDGMGTTEFTKDKVPLNEELIQFRKCKIVGGESLEKKLRLAYKLTLKELGYLKDDNILHIHEDDVPLIYPPEDDESERIYDIFVRKVTLGRHGLQYFENIGNILVWRHGTIQPFEG